MNEKDTICIPCLVEYEKNNKVGTEWEDLKKDPKLAELCNLHKMRIVKNER